MQTKIKRKLRHITQPTNIVPVIEHTLANRKKRSIIPTNFVKCPFESRMASMKASEIRAFINPIYMEILLDRNANKWSKSALGEFMTAINRCLSVFGDDANIHEIMQKFSAWALNKYLHHT